MGQPAFPGLDHGKDPRLVAASARVVAACVDGKGLLQKTPGKRPRLDSQLQRPRFIHVPVVGLLPHALGKGEIGLGRVDKIQAQNLVPLAHPHVETVAVVGRRLDERAVLMAAPLPRRRARRHQRQQKRQEGTPAAGSRKTLGGFIHRANRNNRG